MALKLAVLDDYQEVARELGPWDSLGRSVEMTVFHDHLGSDALVRELLGEFDAIVAMRERTPFTAERLASLPALRLLVTTGIGNAAIDMEAARRQGVVVCGTGSLPSPTAELTWGLIIGLARHIAEEDRRMREGGWQRTVGFELAGHTRGLVGFGKLGRRVAAVAQAFEMDVIAYSQNLDAADAAAAGVEAVAKDEL